MGRLRTTMVTGSTTTTFLCAGDQLVAEYDNAGAMTHRYAFGVGVDLAQFARPRVTQSITGISRSIKWRAVIPMLGFELPILGVRRS
jgi:hypothetical protein